MIEEGLRLMLVGMSGVFGFLVLLVVLMNASGRLWGVLAEWFPEPVAPVPGRASGPGTTGIGGAGGPTMREGAEVAAAIAIAAAAEAARREGRST